MSAHLRRMQRALRWLVAVVAALSGLWCPAAEARAEVVEAPSVSAAPLVVFAPSGAAPSGAAPTASGSTWSWPVAPPHPVTRSFDVTGPYAAGHRGIDLAVPAGAAVAAPAAGVVRFAGVVVDRPVLSIAHDDGSISSFEPLDTAVAPGTRVERGQLVGTVSVTVTHAPSGGLHLGARVEGDYVDPLLLLEAPPPAVLLPLGPDALPR